jgi:hypothetical protein
MSFFSSVSFTPGYNLVRLSILGWVSTWAIANPGFEISLASKKRKRIYLTFMV